MRKALLMFCLAASSILAQAQMNHTLPSGTEIKVRTDVAIPAKPTPNTRYAGTISNDVVDSSGAVLIPRNSQAMLVAVPNGNDTVLDLRTVAVNGRRYSLETQGGASSGSSGIGANKRTGKYVGGGAAVGAILGAIMGGGKGAAIGAILGGAGGAGAQAITGRKKGIPAETELSYKLAQDLQMRPVSTRAAGGMQRR